MPTSNVYAVPRGRATGIFTSWAECQKQTAGYPGAQFKSFTDVREALQWLNGGPSTSSSTGAAGSSHVTATRRNAKANAQHASATSRSTAAKTRRTAAPAPIIPDEEQDYVIFTDGSCLRNPDGPGGWAAVIREVATGKVTELSAGDPSTTNNRMELTAAIKGLSFPAAPAKVALYTDSQYLKNGFTKHWVEGWKRRGWRKADGQPVLNQPLWQALDALFQKHAVTFHWVKGHAGHPLNERCDQLAKAAALQAR